MPVYSGNCSMKKFNKIKCFSYVFTVILTLGFVLTACEKPAVTLTTPESVNGFKLNTYVQIDSYTSVSKNTLTEALNLCDYYENIFSRTKEDSELSKVNSNQTTSISKEMYELVSAGLEYAALSNGAFDITIGSVSRLWDFTAESPKVPDSGRIAEALTHVDYTRVSVSDNGDGTYSISKPDDVILDLGAVAKGYIADKIKDFLEEMKTKITTLTDVLGLEVVKENEMLDEEIDSLIAERQQARKDKDFKRADEIRDLLLEKGIILEDTREGVRWKRA